MPQDHAKRPEFGSGSNPASGVSSPGGAALEGGTYFLGRYRVVDEIGVGGMASVHLARMDGPGGFQKWVAIKKIHNHLVEDDSFVQMFLDEARVAARISHPNVATVFDLGKHDTTYWIAMEYLHGEPLREVMRRTEELGTAMPPEIACRVIADAAEGLHAAHELLGKNGEKLNLVHRDVTPHNLFVTYDGVTKVVDFGIAKFSSRQNQTRAGTLKGKLAYMSPEQVQGETIDRRTDIFALGVVLWELTTGQRLFRMDSDIDTLARVQECNVPRPSTLIRGYPVDLERIVMKTLAKNRNERFRTARELSRALQSLLMRRGLFIASDEVASYTQSIFTDRIQKRDAHLRWASDVTQTINVDKLGLTGTAASGELLPIDRSPSASAIPRVSPAAGTPALSGGGAQQAYARPTPNQAGRAGGPPRPAAGVPAADPHELRPTWVPDQEAPTTHDIPSTDGSPGHMTPPTILAARERGGDVPTNVAVLHDDELEDDHETLVAASAAAAQGMAPHATIPAEHGQVQPYPSPPPNDGPYSGPASGPYNGPVSAPAPFGASGPYDPAAGYPGSGPPSGYQRNGQPNRTEGRNQRTMLAQRFRRRPPLWMVAALSCSFALFAVGVAIAIYSTLNPKPRTRSPQPIAAGSAGPFTAARSAFTTWTANAPPPTSVVTPPASPSVAPAPEPTTPPAVTPPAATPPTNVAPPAPSPTPVANTPAPSPAPVQRAPQAAATPAAPPTPKSSPPQKASFGALTVVCIPKCDQIIDNGTSLGPGHLFNKSVPAGRHLLVLSAPNGVRKSLPVEVFPEKTSEVRLSMEKP